MKCTTPAGELTRDSISVVPSAKTKFPGQFQIWVFRIIARNYYHGRDNIYPIRQFHKASSLVFYNWWCVASLPFWGLYSTSLSLSQTLSLSLSPSRSFSLYLYPTDVKLTQKIAAAFGMVPVQLTIKSSHVICSTSHVKFGLHWSNVRMRTHRHLLILQNIMYFTVFKVTHIWLTNGWLTLMDADWHAKSSLTITKIVYEANFISIGEGLATKWSLAADGELTLVWCSPMRSVR